MRRTDPERRLVAAVLKIAVKDARSGNGGAREWLRGPVAAEYAEGLGLHRDRLAEFVREWQD